MKSEIRIFSIYKLSYNFYHEHDQNKMKQKGETDEDYSNQSERD